MTIDLVSAFVIGLLGAGHCLGMCGGISTMLTSALPTKKSAHFGLSLAYNIGRISSYALIGAIVGFTGSIAAKNAGIPIAGLRLVAGVFLILLGLYLGQWLMLLSRVEQAGKWLWKYLAPLSKKLIPVTSLPKAFSLGAVWGWLPCGLVYSTLTWALASGDALTGAAIMASFGLGTLPAMLAISLGFHWVKSLLKNIIFRKIMAFSVLFYGFYSVVIAYQMMI